MAFFEHDDATIHYQVTGRGFPVLLIAPGGMHSAFNKWNLMPWNPLASLVDNFQVIAMDQRNAGQSTAPISASDGWDTYTGDQLGLMDELGLLWPECALVARTSLGCVWLLRNGLPQP